MVKKVAKCSISRRDASILAEETIAQLRERGMRRTPALDVLLIEMAKEHWPKTLEELAGCPDLKDRNQSTIYRLLVKLEQLGVVRRLGLQSNRSHFQLVVPNHCHDYLVCRNCGKVEEAEFNCKLSEVEVKLMKTTGWGELSHALEFYGFCPDCLGGRAEAL